MDAALDPRDGRLSGCHRQTYSGDTGQFRPIHDSLKGIPWKPIDRRVEQSSRQSMDVRARLSRDQRTVQGAGIPGGPRWTEIVNCGLGYLAKLKDIPSLENIKWKFLIPCEILLR